MKTTWRISKKASLVTVIMTAVLGIAGYSCNESRLGDPHIENSMTGDFWVDQEGKIVYALEGSVILEFPEGTITEPTLFTLSKFPLDYLEMDGYNMMKCGIYLKSDLPGLKFNKSVHLKLPYCVTDFKSGVPVNEKNITIYGIVPDVSAYSIGECCVDCTWDIIQGCINECGIYVIGEK